MYELIYLRVTDACNSELRVVSKILLRISSVSVKLHTVDIDLDKISQDYFNEVYSVPCNYTRTTLSPVFFFNL